MKKKCKTCKVKMQSIMVFEGREYNTGRRSYCFECSPPRLRKDSIVDNKKGNEIGMKRKKKCAECRAVMTTYVMHEGKRYNTSNRVYCMECSPPKIQESKASVATNSDTICVSNQATDADTDDGCSECNKLKRIISLLMKELL